MRQTLLLLLWITLSTISLGQAPQSTPPSAKTADPGSHTENGKLVVLVTWGDVDNTPANNVYVEAYGFVREYNAEKSFLLKMSRTGRYEASLPPGVYDVFVSEGTSIPRCRRVLITSGSIGYWTMKLEIDDVYLEKSGTGHSE